MLYVPKTRKDDFRIFSKIPAYSSRGLERHLEKVYLKKRFVEIMPIFSG
jgi:hypothetical protein